MIQKKERCIVAVILVLFFGVLLSFGPGHYPDTQGYIQMDMAREPLYPLFLLLCRSVMRQEEAGLWLAVVLQNLFCGFCIWQIYFYIRKNCVPVSDSGGGQKKYMRFDSVILCALLLCSLLLPHIVTPLFSSSHMILSDSILSEGLCYPLYQLFIYQLLRVLWGEEKRIGAGFVLAFLLELLRGQMMIAVPVWAVVSAYRLYVSRPKRWLFLPAAGALLLLACRGPAISLYNAAVHDVYAQNTSNNLTALTNLLYASERENGEAIEDETLRLLYFQMYDAMEEKEYTYRFAGKSMQERAVHQEYTHDYIKFDIVTPVLKAHVQSLSPKDGEEINEGVLIDSLAGEMLKPLVSQNPGARLKVYSAVVWCGLVRTAAFLHPGINFITMLVYGVLALLGIRLLWHNREDREGRFLIFTYFIICVNVFATALMIMCLSRYVVYNTSFLYMAAVLAVYKSLTNVLQKKARQE